MIYLNNTANFAKDLRFVSTEERNLFVRTVGDQAFASTTALKNSAKTAWAPLFVSMGIEKQTVRNVEDLLGASIINGDTHVLIVKEKVSVCIKK